MNNVKSLIAALQSAAQDVDGNVTINININQPVMDDIEDVVESAPVLPATDFTLNQRVLVCHIRKNGDRVHVIGTVDTVLGQDSKGWYTRVTGDNGKHYRAGLKYNQERLGTVIYKLG